MSQRDLVAELRSAHVEAPDRLRQRVRLVAAAAPAPPRRFTWRRALVVAVPVVAAVAAAVVFARPASHEQQATPPTVRAAVEHGAAAQPRAASPSGALAVPSPLSRVQTVSETLSLRVRDVSGAVKRAVRVAMSFGGYATAVDAATTRTSGSADLTLKVPRAHVQTAIAELAQIGTIVAEHVDVTDRQAGLNATDRLIARLQKQLATLRAQNAPAAQIAALTQRIASLQRGEAATRRSAHYATIHLHLATPQPAAVHRSHHHGPLHGVAVALEWLGIGAVYALAIGVPVVLVLVLGWLAARLVRRRREDALLSRR